MKIVVIDGNSIINRAFYGVRLLTNREGFYTNAIYGFLNTYFKLIDEEKPDGVCVCFDLKDKTFRHLKFEGYKAKRTAMPEELYMQMPVLKEILGAMGISVLELSGFEADDLIGTISRVASEAGSECVIATGDRDSFQLIGQHVRIKFVSTSMGKTSTRNIDSAEFAKDYNGLSPEKIIDIKALAGDPSDSIPGISGIGEKTALDLVTRFGGVEAIYENIESPEIKPAVQKKLLSGREIANLSRELATIDLYAPFDFSLENAKIGKGDPEKLYAPF